MVNVFKEAKAAYRERKAEVVAGRQNELEGKKAHHAHRALKATVEDDQSETSSRRHSRSHQVSKRHPSDRRNSSGSIRSGSTSPNNPHAIYPSSQNRFSQEIYPLSHTRGGIQRSYTARDDDLALARPPKLPARSMTSPSSPTAIDMDLAYGEMPAPLPVARAGDEQELRGLIGKVKRILEEADCLHYSASAIITTLQKNPDAMAAVALTLAEISNIARKMAPGALTALKGGAPAVFALLASPQFLIAGGVAIGVTIVAFGGYKIIKKIRAKNALAAPGVDEMLEIDVDVSRVDNWRRGIAEVEEQSVGTSVDGEFITPHAALSRLNLNENENEKRSKEKTKSRRTSSNKSGSDTASKASSKRSKGSKSHKTKREKEVKVKKPSPLRLMFQ